MFEVDIAGLCELEGGKPPYRLAFEPVANVFDEFRGYDAERRKPSYCAVTLNHSAGHPRGVWLNVADDGAGFSDERHIWTLFGSTAKRSTSGVSGRFNMGDKQLIALARQATIRTNSLAVTFRDGKREVIRHRQNIVSGTIVEALMPWSVNDLAEVRQQLGNVIAPEGLAYSLNGNTVLRQASRCVVSAKLPTVILTDGVMRESVRKTQVRVIKTEKPYLYELGIPVCSLSDLDFPWSLDVQQKIPLPMSRDTVSPAYLFRLIGGVLEQSALDGVSLLTEEEQGAGFIKGALDWVRNSKALKATVTSLYGQNAVRLSSDPIANAQAAASGASILPGRIFSPETRRRFDEGRILPTSKEVFGGTEAMAQRSGDGSKCPACGRKFEE